MSSDSGSTTVPTIPTPASSAPPLKLVTPTKKVRLQPDVIEVLTNLFELEVKPDGHVECPGCGYVKAKVEANRLKCHGGCTLSASGYDLLAWYLDELHPDSNMRFEAMDSETFKKVEAERERLAIEGVEPLKAKRRKVNEKAVKVARQVWGDLPDKLDRRERNWLKNERGIDPEAVEREGVVRTLRPTIALPRDLKKLKVTHSAAFCLVDHNGDIGALRLRCPEEAAVKAGVLRKTMNQRGAGVMGLVLANRTGVAWLKGKEEAEQLVFAEGEMDFTVWATKRPGLPVFGITKGGWTRDFGNKVKPGTTVIVRTDNDGDGDELALALVATLDPAVECYRLQPDPKGAERDDAERHRLGELDDDPMVGCLRVEVELNLERYKNGKPLNHRANVLTVMGHHPDFKGGFWHNTFDGHMYWRDTRVTDGEIIALAVEMSAAAPGANFAVKTVKEALSYTARHARRHPVIEYLNDLVWDGTARLSRLFPDYLHTHDDKLHRLLGPLWAVGAVARPLRPGCKLDNVLILVGAQGACKSTFVETMAVNEAWTNDTPVDLTSKDARIALMGTWMMEYAELDSLIRSKLSTAKAFLTDRVDRYRARLGKLGRGLSKVDRVRLHHQRAPDLEGPYREPSLLARPRRGHRYRRSKARPRAAVGRGRAPLSQRRPVVADAGAGEAAGGPPAELPGARLLGGPAVGLARRDREDRADHPHGAGGVLRHQAEGRRAEELRDAPGPPARQHGLGPGGEAPEER